MWGIMRMAYVLSDIHRWIVGMITMLMTYLVSECDFEFLMSVAMSNEN